MKVEKSRLKRKEEGRKLRDRGKVRGERRKAERGVSMEKRRKGR